MNRRELIILWAGVLIIVAMMYLFFAPESGQNLLYGVHVDHVRTTRRHNSPCLHAKAGEGSLRLMTRQFR